MFRIISKYLVPVVTSSIGVAYVSANILLQADASGFYFKTRKFENI